MCPQAFRGGPCSSRAETGISYLDVSVLQGAAAVCLLLAAPQLLPCETQVTVGTAAPPWAHMDRAVGGM